MVAGDEQMERPALALHSVESSGALDVDLDGPSDVEPQTHLLPVANSSTSTGS